MRYSIFRTTEGVIVGVDSSDYIKQIAQRQFGSKLLGEFDEAKYKDEDEALIAFVDIYGL